MRLYARVQSERAEVAQGGNKSIVVSLTYERREVARVTLTATPDGYTLSTHNAGDTDSAEHPVRQQAIRVIEEAVEPVLRLQRGVNGEQYYELEDAIVNVLATPIVKGEKQKGETTMDIIGQNMDMPQ